MDAQAAELETIALEVARAAGSLVMEGFRQQFTVSAKGPQRELFTEYDVRSEELVRTLLAERTPGIPIVGEEQGGEAGDELTWYVDPIDGTINFVAGHPFFAVSVGVMRRDKPVAGAVVAPVLGWEWFGSVINGTKKNGVPCQVSTVSDLSEAVIATGFPGRTGTESVGSALRLAQYARLCASVRDIRRCGSAAIDLCLVADGTYALAWMRRISLWDIAAGAALVQGAGGDFQELEPATATAQYLASNRVVEPAFLELLQNV